ncbi:MAG: substrate-binding domain-containing protein, partial [Kiritimatiellia bacterium]
MKIYDLSDKMMGWVKAKGLKPGARVPSSREFAEALGLGRMQVNRAMTDMVGRGLLYRQGNRYFLGAGTKNTQAHPPIDLFVEKWHQTRALADMAARWDLELRVHVTDEPEEVRKGLLDLQGEEIQTSGILIYGGQFAKELGDFQKRGIPVVVFSESSDSLDSVSPDTGRMAEIAVRKLIEAGHRELAFVSPPGFQAFPLTRSQAEAGYRQCCLDFNLTASAERMLHVDEGESALNNFWQMFEPGYPMVSALVCETPFIAHRLLKKIRREGLRVPGSLSVVALFEDDFSAMDVRKLCAVGINMDRLTRLALGVLLEKIEWKQMGKRHAPGLSSMRLEPEFFPGGSLGPPRSELGAASERMEAGPVARETWPTERKDRISEVRKINRHPFPNP